MKSFLQSTTLHNTRPFDNIFETPFKVNIGYRGQAPIGELEKEERG